MLLGRTGLSSRLSEKEDVDHGWRSYNAWVAYFDLLGFEEKLDLLCFKEKSKTSRMFIIQDELDEIVQDLKGEVKEFEENLSYLFYADTFVLYSKSDANKHYAALLHAATHFMEKCIYKGMALRGAISFDEIAVGHDNRIMIGRAFVDSHRYGEDQDWLGLILTPTAFNRLKEAKPDPLDPRRHGFVCGETPLRKCLQSNDEVYAYSFCRGAYSYPCPLLHKLAEMRDLSPGHAKHKYENTIRFLERHWRKIQC